MILKCTRDEKCNSHLGNNPTFLDEISYEKPLTLTKDWIRNHQVTSKNNGKDLTCNSLKRLTRTYIICFIVKLVNLIFLGVFIVTLPDVLCQVNKDFHTCWDGELLRQLAAGSGSCQWSDRLTRDIIRRTVTMVSGRTPWRCMYWCFDDIRRGLSRHTRSVQMWPRPVQLVYDLVQLYR